MEEMEVVAGMLFVRRDLSWAEGAQRFRKAGRELLSSPERELVIDLSAVNLVSSSYLAEMASLAALARSRGKSLVLRVNDRLHRFLTSLGLDHTLRLVVVEQSRLLRMK